MLLYVRKDTITLWKNKSSLSYRIPETWSTSETIQEHFNSKEETQKTLNQNDEDQNIEACDRKGYRSM